MKKSSNEVLKLQQKGFYRDVELPAPAPDTTEIAAKYSKLTGDNPNYEVDNRHTLLEMMVNVDLAGFQDLLDGEPTEIGLPYVITIDKSSNIILSIRRNWRESDALKLKRQHFVHYQYLPGLGFYGFGLVHMIGGLTKSATSLLRQLVDAGTLANLPGGLKSRGLRIKGDDSPIMPGEFRDVDVPGGIIRDNITFLPYKEPSATLANLLGVVVDSGKRFAQVADAKIADVNSQAPVGTTVALIEQGSKIISSIHKRLHYGQKQEFRMLSEIFSENPVPYPYFVGNVPPETMQQDFDGRVDILPVSDPNIFSMAQRLSLAQTQLQMAQAAPQMHNLREAYRRMYDALDIKNIDAILPEPPQPATY